MNELNIKVKVSRVRAEQLKTAYAWLIGEWVPLNDHEVLLQTHIADMYVKVTRLLKKQFRNTAVVMTSAEALAFCQTWADVSLDHLPYASVIVLDIMAKIDKCRADKGLKTPKHLHHAY